MADKKLETRIWDSAEHLETDEDIAAYLDAALEDGDLPWWWLCLVTLRAPGA